MPTAHPPSDGPQPTRPRGRPPGMADLVLLALGHADPAEAQRIEAHLGADSRLRAAYEEVAAHLLRYEALGAPPPAPPRARVLARLCEQGPAPRPGLPRTHRAWGAWVRAAAALLVVGLGLALGWPSGGGERGPPELTLHAGRLAAAPEGGWRALGRVRADLGPRVALVLAPEARLGRLGPDSLELRAGLGWFEVDAAPFEVVTPHGSVAVLGTRFEVEVGAQGLRVAVEEGRVRAGGRVVRAGEELAADRVQGAARAPGLWLDELSLAARDLGPTPSGHALELTLRNAGARSVRLPTGAGTGAPLLLLRLAGPSGQPLDLPLDLPAPHPAPPLPPGPGGPAGAPADDPDPAGELRLRPGASARFTLRFAAPGASAGAYRLTAFYRPPGRPPVASEPLLLELR